MTEIHVDERLCKSHLLCPSFQQSYKAHESVCSGCKGDITGLSLISTCVDKHINPIIATVSTTDANHSGQLLVGAALAIREELNSHGQDCSPGEVGMLISVRLMQRVQELETRARVRARRRR